MNLVLFAIAALALIGLLSAVLLATAAQKFHVDVDPRVQAILDVLPGANCGACGRPGCFAAAESIAEGTASVTSCVAGGQEVADNIAAIMGADAGTIEKVVSCRHCGGGTNATRAYEYAGFASCNAVSKMAGGSLGCPYGCLGYGDCAAACPFDAITMDERGLPVIDLRKCTGCSVCLAECPRPGLLELVPEGAAVAVRCNSKDKVPARRGYCTMSCIACRKCEKACPSDAIHVIDMMAVVDHEKCTGCYSCVAVCPQDCIDVTGRGAVVLASLIDGKADSFSRFECTAETAEPEEAVEA